MSKRLPHLVLDAGFEHPGGTRDDAPLELLRWQLEAEDHRRVPRVARPEPVLFRRERAAGGREFEGTDDPAPVVRMDSGGGLGVAAGKERVRALCTLRVVEGFPAIPLARRGRRWKVELGERRAQVEA